MRGAGWSCNGEYKSLRGGATLRVGGGGGCGGEGETGGSWASDSFAGDWGDTQGQVEDGVGGWCEGEAGLYRVHSLSYLVIEAPGVECDLF